MKKLISLLAFLFCASLHAQQSAWGTKLIQQPNAFAGRVYMGVTNVIQGSNMVFTYVPSIGAYIISSTGGGGGGSGTVTSVGLTVPTIFSVSGSPVTTSGTLAVSANNQSANTFYAGPTSGGATTPAFRALDPNDMPTVPVTKGGTSRTSLDDTQVLIGNGTSAVETSPDLTMDTGAHTFAVGASHATDVVIHGGLHVYNVGTDVELEPNIKLDALATGKLLGIASDGSKFVVSATVSPPLDYSSDVLSIPQADSGTDGFLSSADWSAFNAKLDDAPSDGTTYGRKNGTWAAVTGGTGTLTGVTNAGGQYSIISESNAPVIKLKSISAGSNVTITDQETNLVISASGGGGGGSGGIDFSMSTLNPYSNGTNYAIDFTLTAQKILSTNQRINFTYSTNWGNITTSRVVNLFIPATNYYRRVYFSDAATNWNSSDILPYGLPSQYAATIRFQSFNPGETNVEAIFTLNENKDLTQTNSMDLAGVTGIRVWCIGDTGMYQSGTSAYNPSQNGSEVRWWTDLSGNGNHFTNNVAYQFCVTRSTPRFAIDHIPSVTWIQAPNVAGSSSLTTPAFSALSQPNWFFIVVRTSRGGPALFDGDASSARFSCFPATERQNLQLYCGAALYAANPNPAEYALYSFCQNGASSFIRTNGGQFIAGNSGSQTITRMILGSDYAKGALQPAADVAEIAFVHDNLAGTSTLTNIENYLMDKYGLNWK